MGYLAAFEVSSGNAPTSAAALGGGLAVGPAPGRTMLAAVTWTSGNAPTFGFGEPFTHVTVSGGGNAPVIVTGTVAYPG